jgi:cytoskeletal protein RodZ
MTESLGEQLRVAREARGITLREISDETRIATRYLEAIEQNNYKSLPGGIFNKSFVKAYAKQIGFDEKEALDAYARTAREMGTDPDEVSLTPHSPMEQFSNSRSPIVTLLLTVLILGILSLSAYGLLHWYQNRGVSKQEAAAPRKAPATAAPAVDQAPAETPGSSPAPNGALNVEGKTWAPVWIRTKVDEDDPTAVAVNPGEAQAFFPKQTLKIEFAKVNAPSVTVAIDGKPVRVEPDMSGKGNAIILIDKNSPPPPL